MALATTIGERVAMLRARVDRVAEAAGRSAGSVAIALSEAVECGRIKRGDLVLLVVFGAGLTWGAAVIEW